MLDGVHICEGAAIAPGSVVTPRKTVGSGEVWAGIPARKVRTLSAAEKEEIRKMCSDLTEVGARKRSDAQSANLHAEETANQLFICSSYLSRLFKKQTGESFIQYVTRVKMEKAVELLKDPQYKTYQVSQMLGYKTSRYFSRLFRAQTGMNPSEYRGRVLHVGGEFDEN